jgi:hypothetical protein
MTCLSHSGYLEVLAAILVISNHAVAAPQPQANAHGHSYTLNPDKSNYERRALTHELEYNTKSSLSETDEYNNDDTLDDDRYEDPGNVK